MIGSLWTGGHLNCRLVSGIVWTVWVFDMKISIKDARSNFDELIGKVQQSGRRVELYQGEKVVAVISPVNDSSRSSASDSTKSAVDDSSAYCTWGETLADL